MSGERAILPAPKEELGGARLARSWHQPRSFAYLCFALVVVGLSVLPVLREPHRDDYPFSSYPMFASKREAPHFVLLRARAADGSVRALPPALLGTDEVMQAAATLRRAARDRKSAAKICRAVLSRLDNKKESVELVEVSYDPIVYFTEGPAPLSERVVQRCGEFNQPRRGAKRARKNRGGARKKRAMKRDERGAPTRKQQGGANE